MIKINGKEYDFDSFAFDGCHKIYVFRPGESRDYLYSVGWEDSDFHPIEELAETFFDSCPLRFIEGGVELESIVPQCESFVTFDIGNKHYECDFKEDRMNVTEAA